MRNISAEIGRAIHRPTPGSFDTLFSGPWDHGKLARRMNVRVDEAIWVRVYIRVITPVEIYIQDRT